VKVLDGKECRKEVWGRSEGPTQRKGVEGDVHFEMEEDRQGIWRSGKGTEPGRHSLVGHEADAVEC